MPVWDALAAALPDGASAVALHLDRDGVGVTLSAADEAAALAALGALSAEVDTGSAQESASQQGLRAEDEPGGRRRLVVQLPRAVAGGDR